MSKCEFCNEKQARYKIFYSNPLNCVQEVLDETIVSPKKSDDLISSQPKNKPLGLLYKKICTKCFNVQKNREKFMNDNICNK